MIFVHLALLCFSEATVFDVNLQERVSKDPITALSADGGFNGINFMMVVHEQHPFVFFDRDPVSALEEWNKIPKAAGIEPVPSEPVEGFLGWGGEGLRYGRIGGWREKVRGLKVWVDRWAEGEGKGGVWV